VNVVVLDAWSRRIVGWSIADHIRSELVVDALQMALWRRRPPADQCIAHADHGSQYTSWAFGSRLRAAGLLGSMGSIGADSGRFRTPIPAESVHRFRRFRTPLGTDRAGGPTLS
jgi:transposase InsO family protein